MYLFFAQKCNYFLFDECNVHFYLMQGLLVWDTSMIAKTLILKDCCFLWNYKKCKNSRCPLRPKKAQVNHHQCTKYEQHFISEPEFLSSIVLAQPWPQQDSGYWNSGKLGFLYQTRNIQISPNKPPDHWGQDFLQCVGTTIDKISETKPLHRHINPKGRHNRILWMPRT